MKKMLQFITNIAPGIRLEKRVASLAILALRGLTMFVGGPCPLTT